MKSPVLRALNGIRASASPAILAALLLSFLPICGRATVDPPAGLRYNGQPHDTSVRVDGTSTTHDWEMEGTVIGGYIEFGAGVTLDKAAAAPGGLQGNTAPAKSHLMIPVHSVHSKADHMPTVMDDLMKKAMKEETHPTIEFTLKVLTFKGPHVAGKPFDFDVSGDLVIAGVTNKATFPITLDCVDETTIKVSGSAPVKMTAYGIEPPVPNIGLGLMKCGDDVKINFDWTLKRRK